MTECPKAGTRVCLRAGANKHNRDSRVRECGAVTAVTFVVKEAMNMKRHELTCAPHPKGGGIVYVRLDRGKVLGVDSRDLVAERSGKALGRARRRR